MSLSEYEQRTVELTEEKEKRVADKPRFLVNVVGFILLAISLITSGVAYIEVAIHGDNFYWDDGYMIALSCYVDYVTMPILLIIAGYGFRHNVYVASTFFLIFGVFNLVYAIACRMQELTTVSGAYICIIMGILILFPALVSLQSKVYMFAVAGIMLAIGLIAGEFIHPGNMIYGVFTLISGWIFVYIGFGRLIYYELGVIIPYF